MYPKAAWWQQRTTGPEYQQAYERIAAAVPKARLVLDAGCGTGELMKRLLLSRKSTSVAGIDIDARLLETAASNLKSSGIVPFQVFVPQLLSHILSYKASLIEGDMAHYPLPERYFSGAIFSFPAIVTPKEVLAKGSYAEVTAAVLHRILKNISRSIRPGGFLIQAEYDTYSTEKDAEKEAEAIYAALGKQHGFSLQTLSFYEDERVAVDVDFQKQDELRKGYVIARHIKKT